MKNTIRKYLSSNEGESFCKRVVFLASRWVRGNDTSDEKRHFKSSTSVVSKFIDTITSAQQQE